VDVLKIDIPRNATPDTPWQATRLARRSYFRPVASPRARLGDEAPMGYEIAPDAATEKDSDSAVVREGTISVTPLSLDLTSRITLDILHDTLNHN
jgi:5'-nucleotidase